MMRPRVTIGMPVYNCESTIAESIGSILNQTFADWQLIVYDDGSSDGTVVIAKLFRDPRIRIIETGRNMGLGHCLNEIVAQCDTDFFARMDGDDVSYPTRLEEQLKFLSQHPDVDLVGGWMMVFQTSAGRFGVRRGAQSHEHICKNPAGGIPMPHPTWLGRSAWFRNNPYDPRALRMEDWELLMRTYRKSKFANVPRVVLGYREDALSIAKLIQARGNICRTAIRYAREHRMYRFAAQCLAGQIARLALDVTAVGTRLDRRLLKHRVPRAPIDLIAEWNDVLEETRARVAGEIGASDTQEHA